MDSQDINDEDVISLRYNMSMSLSQKKAVCTLCDNCTFSLEQYYMLNIATELNGPLEQIIVQEMSQVINKSCYICLHNTLHTESQTWIDPPQCLVIIMNRLSCRRG